MGSKVGQTKEKHSLRWESQWGGGGRTTEKHFPSTLILAKLVCVGHGQLNRMQ